MVKAQARVNGVPLLDVDTPSSILSKAFDLLRAFNSNERVMSLTELSEASGLAKSTVHRLLARLVELGAIEHHRGSYRIGIEVFRLGVTSLAASMRDTAISHLATLHRQTGRTVQLGVMRGHEVVFWSGSRWRRRRRRCSVWVVACRQLHRTRRKRAKLY